MSIKVLHNRLDVSEKFLFISETFWLLKQNCSFCSYHQLSLSQQQIIQQKFFLFTHSKLNFICGAESNMRAVFQCFQHIGFATANRKDLLVSIKAEQKFLEKLHFPHLADKKCAVRFSDC